jgi:hypothetical protein
MRAVYATQFQIADGEFGDVAAQVRDWIDNRYRYKFKLPVDLAPDGTTRHPEEGHRLRLDQQTPPGGTLLEVEWIHPDTDPHADRSWQTEVALAASGKILEFSIILRVGASASFAVEPIGQIELGTPRLVRNLLDDFECRSSGIEITSRHTVVRRNDVRLLVDHIQYDRRALPIVLLSQEDGAPARPVRVVQEKLMGLAHVYEIEPDAGFELTRVLGKSNSCFNGAARVYWPGFRPSAFLRNPLYFKEKIEEFEANGRLLEDYLFQKFASIAASRFNKGQTWQELRQEIKDQQLGELHRLRERVQRQRTRADEEDEFLKEMETLMNRNENLLEENRSLQDRVQDLESELATTRENLLATYEHKESVSAEPHLEEEGAQHSKSFRSVLAALRRADDDFEEIQVWNSALDSAENSAFARPDEVYNALQAINDLSGRYFEGSDRSIGRPIGEFFQSRNLKYAPQESEATMNLYGEERQFHHNGTRREMERHLTLGGGSRQDCIQIYFDPDEGTDCFAIGYCGPHLRYYSQNT